jgi:hypothetical protein
MKYAILTAAVFFVTVLSAAAQDSQVNLSDYNKPGTILFSTVQAPRSGALLWNVSGRFAESDIVHGCAFFSYKFGTLEKDERGFLDIRIDGKFIRRYYFDNRDVLPSSLRMRLYVHNTGKDDFDASVFSPLSAGEHRMLVSVGIEKNRPDSPAEERKLAEGFFIFIR